MSFTLITAALIATIIPALVLYIVYRMDLYSTGEFKYTLNSFVWGGIAFYAAVQVNTASLTIGLVSTQAQMARFVAPPVEEILKGIILIYLVTRPKFTYFVDGAIYGFAVGIGFAIIENYEYISYNLDAALDIAISRVISTNLIHGAASALTGIGLGLSRFEKGFNKFISIFIGYGLAILLHLGFNNLVNISTIPFYLILGYAAATGIGGTVVIIVAIKRGLKIEKAWIEEKLGMADRVTAGEAAVVNRLENVDEILLPLKQRFGEEKTKQIKEFLIKQAHLGIRRKTLDKASDEKMKESIREQIHIEQKEMDAIRKKVGVYTMMYLRGIFPLEDSPLWDHLESVIEDRIKQGGGEGAMWKSLETKFKEQSSSMFDKID